MRNKYSLLLLVAFLFLSQSCAVIVGGSKFNANVTVDDHPSAEIYHEGERKGKGYASFKIDRQDANITTFEIRQEGCETQTFNYTKRKIRGWALAGSIIFWTGGTGPLLIPYGTIIDFAFGAVYKPDITEQGILKNNYKTYNYILDYTGCNNTNAVANDSQNKSLKSREERLIALKALYQDGLITKEEYEREKKKILDEL